MRADISSDSARASRGHDLRFDDQRTFGHLKYDEGEAVLPSPIAHIALDPFDPLFDQASAAARINS